MITVQNLTLNFGSRILFEDVNVQFTEGNCYGVIGANGAGKSTFLKIIAGEMEQSKGAVELTPGQRVAGLRQDHFQCDEETGLDTGLRGHEELWKIGEEREEIYSKADV